MSNDYDVTRHYARTLGQELRRRRTALGLTRKALLERVPDDVSVQAMATWELATRQVTVTRLVDMSQALGTVPHEILSVVDGRVFDRLVMVDLAVLARTDRAELVVARRWARAHLSKGGTRTVFEVTPQALAVLATLSDITPERMATALRNAAVSPPGRA